MPELPALLLFSVAVPAFLATLLGLLPDKWWAVRVVDLMRARLAYLLLALAALSALFAPQWAWALLPITLGGAAVNVFCVWPYWPFAPTDTSISPPPAGADTFSVLFANVLMTNQNYERLIRQISAADPDIVLLTEVDHAWAERLRPFLQNYDFIREEPRDDTFGKIFASRLPVTGFDLSERRGEDTPSLRAMLKVGDEALIEFIGLHPEAPLPGHGEQTRERDISILRAAKTNTRGFAGALVMGDFNDVPWSPPTSRFRKLGNWRDPRAGRGTYPTFPASAVQFGWPLDQIFINDRIEVSRFDVLPANGSDHRAIYGEFYLAPEAEAAA